MTTVVLGALWALWPLVALAGGLAYSALSGLAALVLLPVIAKSLRPRLYFLALVAFFVFAGVSALWSPREQPLVEFDLADMQFAVRSEMLRVGLQILAQAALIAAAMRLGESGRARVQGIAQVAMFLQLAVLVVLTVFEQQIIEQLTWVPATGESVQNISRNSLIMSVAAPVLAIGLVQNGRWRQGAGIAFLVVAATAGVLAFRGVHAGLLALAASACAVTLVHFAPRHGFKVMAVLTAVAVLAAPLVFTVVTQGADFATADDSFSYRAAIWKRVIALINEDPVLGGGLGLLRTVHETIETGAFAGEPTIPNHSHNMLLQLWAETGAVGAALLSLAIVLVGWRVPDVRVVGAAGYKGAAIAAGMFAGAAVSFDLWNEWWWAVGGLLIALTVATPAQAAEQTEEPAGAGIVFGEAAAASAAAEIARPEPAMEVREPTAHTENNFNLLRLIFALMVAVYHAIALPGLARWEQAEGWTSLMAEIGVQGFFVLSGYLVWASLERSSSLGAYAEKRVRRLVPGYATVVIICAVAALILVPATRENLAHVARYLGWNLAFLNFMEPGLPGVFEANRFTEVNGALWTLKIEVMFYLILPILAWVLRAVGTRRWILFVLIYAGAEVWRYLLEQGAATQGGVWFELSRQLPGQMSFFVTGIALCAWQSALNWKSMLAPLGLVLLIASILVPQAEVVRAAGLGIVAVWLAVGLPKLFDAARFGDLSYGVYIVHFPIIQCVVAAGIFATSPALAFAIVGGSSLAAALLLWWLVERPALRRDSGYRRSELRSANV